MRPNGCLGRSKVVHRMFRHRHSRRNFLNMLKTVAKRLLKGGLEVAEWRHKHCRGYRMDALWPANGRHVIEDMQMPVN